MIDPVLMALWLSALLSGQPQAPNFAVGPNRPELEFPDNLGIVTPMPGPGSGTEGLIDFPVFQIRIRGLTPYYAQLANQANMVDQALVFGLYPANIWGSRILTVGRPGSGPVPVNEDPTNQRISFMCNYLVTEAISIGSPVL